MPYRLHCFAQSGNAFKVATMLNLLGEEWEPVFVDFFNGQTRDPTWRAEVNEMGEAPVLEDGKLKLAQSGLILMHLAEKHGRFGGKTKKDQREIMRWILFDNHKFTSYFASYRFTRAFLPAEPEPALMNWLKGRIDAAFGVVDKHLAEQPFMIGKKPTIADISMCGYLFYPPEEHGYEFGKTHPRIADWLKRISDIKGFRMPYDTLPGERRKPLR